MTVPVTPPGFSVTSKLLVFPISNSTFSEVESAKPEALVLMSYRPAGNKSILYAPLSSVTAVLDCPVALFVAVTVAPLIRPPFLSETDPLSAPLAVTCAIAETAKTVSTIKNDTIPMTAQRNCLTEF